MSVSANKNPTQVRPAASLTHPPPTSLSLSLTHSHSHTHHLSLSAHTILFTLLSLPYALSVSLPSLSLSRARIFPFRPLSLTHALSRVLSLAFLHSRFLSSFLSLPRPYNRLVV